MEDADSDSGFDSDGDWYHAGRDIVHEVMKKETWKTLIQILVSILTAIGTTLGVTSCMGYGPIAML